MQDKSDAELIAQSLEGETEAYAELVDRYKDALYRHCFAIVRNEDAAEDMAQDTFIAAYYALQRYNPRYRLSTWLFKIATNKCLNYLRQKAREVSADDGVIASIASTAAGPAEDAQAQELRDAVARLKPKYRAVISLYYWQGCNYQEIAVALAVPSGSVKGWLSRAKTALRKELS